MTEKELRKLHRQDLLQLLVEQGREAVQLGNQLAETEENLNQMQSGNDRLKTKLDEKDEQLERLKERLDEKDAMINKLKSRLDEKDAKIHNLNADMQALQKRRQLEIDEIIKALKLGGLLELIQQASDQYMLNLRRTQETIVEQEPPYAIGAAAEALESAEDELELERSADAASAEDTEVGIQEEITGETCEEAASEEVPVDEVLEDTSAGEAEAQAFTEEASEAELSDETGEAAGDSEAKRMAELSDADSVEADCVQEQDTTEENPKEDTNIAVDTQESSIKGASGLGEPVFVKRPHFWQKWRRRR